MKKGLLSLVCTLIFFGINAQNTLKGFGDSNTDYWSDLPKEKKWFHIVGSELNLVTTNYGIAGATIYGSTGLETTKNNATVGSKDYATFMYGTNDAYKNLINAQWKADYKSFIQHFISNGYDPKKLFIISPNYDPSDADGAAYLNQVALAAQYAKEISNELGINYVGLYEEMRFIFDASTNPLLSLSVFGKPTWWLVGGKHLNERGHRMLADIFKNNFKPSNFTGGNYRVKLFGAGSAMAGISTYHHSFVELFGNETARHPRNYAIAGTGIMQVFPGDTAQLDWQKSHATDGTKDIAIFLYGNNDGNGTETWKNNYKTQIQHFINVGYDPQNLVIITITMSPNLQASDVNNYNRLKAANNRIRQIAQELGIRLIDTESMFPNANQFSDDYHINDASNEVLAAALKAMFPAGGNTGCVTPPAPTISVSGATTFCQGGNVILTSSAATGNQWFKNGSAISGATSQTLQITESGSYTVQVSNGNCNATSAATVVTVNSISSTPTITASDATSFCEGGNVTLSTTTTGTLQWYKDGNAISGATAQTYTATASGSYTVVAGTNGCTSTSAPVVITVSSSLLAPTVSASGPVSFCEGGNVTLTSSVSSGNQWLRNGVEIPNANSNTLQVSESGNYSVKISNGTCSTTSLALTVTVNAATSAPNISVSGATTICQGSSVVLSTTATGTLQWNKNGIAINGATAQTLTVTESGNYTVTSGSGSCSAISNSISITVTSSMTAPSITSSGALSFCQGGNVTLTSSASSGNQWLKNGVEISGATNQTLQVSESGNYSVKTSNASCSATSGAVTVTVNSTATTPVITASGATSFCSGGSVTLTSSASGTLQWFKNGSAINGATSQTYTATEGGNYTVVSGTNGCTATSAPISITVNAAIETPAISASGATTFCQGGNVTLTSSATSGNQWFKNGSPISGENNKTITINSSGVYTVQVNANGCSSNISSEVTITVNEIPAKPVITVSGNELTSTANAGNQWFLNGSLLHGSNDKTLVAIVSGTYTVRVSVNGCSALSDPFTYTAPTNPADSTLSNTTLNLFPNPFNNNLNVVNKTNHRLEVRVINMQGAVVQSEIINPGSHNIGVHKLTRGSYIISVTDTYTLKSINRVMLKQ